MVDQSAPTPVPGSVPPAAPAATRSSPLTPGDKTSEGFLAKVVTYAGLVLAALGTVVEIAQAAQVIPMAAPYAGKVLIVAGLAASVVKSIAFGLNRLRLKKAILEAMTPEQVQAELDKS